MLNYSYRRCVPYTCSVVWWASITQSFDWRRIYADSSGISADIFIHRRVLNMPFYIPDMI